jgi:hypothetical protein
VWLRFQLAESSEWQQVSSLCDARRSPAIKISMPSTRARAPGGGTRTSGTISSDGAALAEQEQEPPPAEAGTVRGAGI